MTLSDVGYIDKFAKCLEADADSLKPLCEDGSKYVGACLRLPHVCIAQA